MAWWMWIDVCENLENIFRGVGVCALHNQASSALIKAYLSSMRGIPLRSDPVRMKVMTQSTPRKEEPLWPRLVKGQDSRLVVSDVEGADEIQPIVDRAASRSPSLRPEAAEVLRILHDLNLVATKTVMLFFEGGHSLAL